MSLDPPQRSASAPAFRFAVTAAVLTWIGGVFALVASNPRLLASWHGFLHAGIASRFPSATFVPENPFFAGQPIAYYWFYQWVGHVISRLTGTDLLHAFQIIALSSLALLVVTGAAAGRQLYRSTAAGLIVGYLALAGMNPLGPAIAAAKYLTRGEPIIQHTRVDPGGDVFVSNDEADDRMARPLLGALQIGVDWRTSQNLVWFFDVSSRAPALALLMTMAWLLTRPGSGRGASLALLPIGALTAALNPIIGFAAAGALVAASAMVWLIWRRDPQRAGAGVVLQRSVAFFAGSCASFPLAAHLLAFPNPVAMTLGSWMVVKAAALVAGFLILAPLSAWALRYGPAAARPALTALALAAGCLLVPVPVLALVEGNQHNMVNAASCLLALPAAAWVAGRNGSNAEPRSRRRALWLFAAFLPVTACAVFAFAGRPPLPIAFDHGSLRRLPAEGPLDAFYRWAAASTPANAVLLCDPDHPVKMSGNVSEIPALTGRALFIDQLTYMTAPYPARALRTEIVARALAGEPFTAAQQSYLSALDRPLYLVTFAAGDSGLAGRLIDRFGQPVFRQDFVAAFQVAAR